MLPRVRNEMQAAIEVKNIMQDAVANATSGSTHTAWLHTGGGQGGWGGGRKETYPIQHDAHECVSARRHCEA